MPRNEVFALIDEVTLSLQNAKKVPFTDSSDDSSRVRWTRSGAS